MTPSLYSLLGFVVWTLLVVMAGIGLPRISAVLARRAPPKSFVANEPHGSERYRRTMRAHVNCVENLPLFAALVLIAHAIKLESTLSKCLPSPCSRPAWHKRPCTLRAARTGP